MNQGDTSRGSVDVSTDDRQPEAESGGGVREKVPTAIRKSARSGTLAGVGGGLTVLRGVRSIRRGKWLQGIRRLLVGGGLVAIAARQRRSRGSGADVDQTDVVDTTPDVEGAVDGTGGQPDHASGDEASAVVDTAPDVEDAAGEGASGVNHASGDQVSEVVDTSPDVEDAVDEDEGEESVTASDDEAGWSEVTATDSESAAGEVGASYDRLGAAAFDEHKNEVPAPQQAFDREFLALDAEVVWGIRAADDAVVVSQLWDPMEETEAVQYVASSQISEDRVVTVPDEILDHWDEVAGGGVAVSGGDDIVFATTDELAEQNQLLVVPAAWADDHEE